MATESKRDSPVLMIVDMQVGVLANTWEPGRVIENTVLAVDRARAARVPVVWVQHSNDDLPENSAAWQLAPGLIPAEGEKQVHKRFNSSFEQTNLEQIMAELQVNHVVLAGAATNWCIRATAYGALERGYDLTLIGDAHTTEDIELKDGDTIQAASTIKELNIAIQWLEYPDRQNKVVAVRQLDFSH